MSYLTWEYSIIIGEETKNVNENGVQVIKQGITLVYLDLPRQGSFHYFGKHRSAFIPAVLRQ